MERCCAALLDEAFRAQVHMGGAGERLQHRGARCLDLIANIAELADRRYQQVGMSRTRPQAYFRCWINCQQSPMGAKI